MLSATPQQCFVQHVASSRILPWAISAHAIPHLNSSHSSQSPGVGSYPTFALSLSFSVFLKPLACSAGVIFRYGHYALVHALRNAAFWCLVLCYWVSLPRSDSLSWTPPRSFLQGDSTGWSSILKADYFFWFILLTSSRTSSLSNEIIWLWYSNPR